MENGSETQRNLFFSSVDYYRKLHDCKNITIIIKNVNKIKIRHLAKSTRHFYNCKET